MFINLYGIKSIDLVCGKSGATHGILTFEVAMSAKILLESSGPFYLRGNELDLIEFSLNDDRGSYNQTANESEPRCSHDEPKS